MHQKRVKTSFFFFFFLVNEFTGADGSSDKAAGGVSGGRWGFKSLAAKEKRESK